MNTFFSDKEINEKLSKLNACQHPSLQWEQKKAQKKHVDLFGKAINEGEAYFRLHIDPGFSNDLKLSSASMDCFLYAIFAPYPAWEQASEQIIQNKLDKNREIINKLRR